ncbi:MAG: DUF1702 family protein [Pirellula sp.]
MIASPWKWLRTRALSVPLQEVLLERRGFVAKDAASATRLEGIGASFLAGYHTALADEGTEPLQISLDDYPDEQRGFAYEGAAMALWILDALSPLSRHRWTTFIALAAPSQPYITHVGVGWALARLPWSRRRPERALASLDPTLGWLAIDGYGFHEGYFHTDQWIYTPSHRPAFSRYANRAFDQGLGRSLWFVEGTDVDRIARRIQTFDAYRHEDLWSGVGLACAYAGQATQPELESLMLLAGDYLPSLRQGITFGAEARIRAGIANPHTEQTCWIVCDMDAQSAAALTRATRVAAEQSPSTSDCPTYESWRMRLRQCLTHQHAKVLL